MPSLSHAPRLSLQDAARLARDLYGITASASPLPSERDQNFLLHRVDRTRAVLKVANAAETLQVLDAENRVMKRLAATGLAPSLVPTITGEEIGRHGEHFVRLVTCLDGAPLGNTARQSHALLRDLGRAVAVMDRALAGFDHPALHRAFHWDLATAPTVIADRLPLVRDAALRDLIERVVVVHRDTVAPRLPSFRQRAIHGDVNDYNVLVDGRAQRVTGIVDFGDMVVSHTGERRRHRHGVRRARPRTIRSPPRPVAAGYHAVHPLTEDEIAALFGLMLTRLA
jgi:Ser/Thr protein kinase RdoA (MazF antagonist)